MSSHGAVRVLVRNGVKLETPAIITTGPVRKEAPPVDKRSRPGFNAELAPAAGILTAQEARRRIAAMTLKVPFSGSMEERQITARFDSKCSVCWQKVATGDQAVFNPAASTVRHPECGGK